MAKTKPNTIEVENFTSPGRTHRVDATKYGAMKTAIMAVVSGDAPGMTVAELRTAIAPHLPEDVFPGGATGGWWMKCVQLDLEAKKVLVRAVGSPVRLRKA